MKKLYTFFYLCCILISFIACDREKVEYTEGGDPQMVDIRLKELLNVQVTEVLQHVLLQIPMNTLFHYTQKTIV